VLQFLRRALDEMLAELEGKRHVLTETERLFHEQQIHNTCLLEVVRQVTVQCHERGALLKGLVE
jgi:hypothetical protein